MIEMTPISLKQDLTIYNQGWPQTIDSSAWASQVLEFIGIYYHAQLQQSLFVETESRNVAGPRWSKAY